MAENSEDKKKEDEDRKSGVSLPWTQGGSQAAPNASIGRQLLSPLKDLAAFLKGLPELGAAGAARALAVGVGKNLVFVVPFVVAGYLAVHYADKLTSSQHHRRRAAFARGSGGGSAADAEGQIRNEGLGIAGVHTEGDGQSTAESPMPIPERMGEGEDEEQPPPRKKKTDAGTAAAGFPDPAALAAAAAAGAAGEGRAGGARLQKMPGFSEQSGGSSQASFGGGAQGGAGAKGSGQGGSANAASGAKVGGAEGRGKDARARIAMTQRGQAGTDKKASRQLVAANRLSNAGLSADGEKARNFTTAAFDGQAIGGQGASIGAATPGGTPLGAGGAGVGGGGQGAGASPANTGGDAMESALGELGGASGGQCDLSKQKKLKQQFDEKDVTPYQENLDEVRELAQDAKSSRNWAWGLLAAGMAAITFGAIALGDIDGRGILTPAAVLAALGSAITGAVGNIGSTPEIPETKPERPKVEEKSS